MKIITKIKKAPYKYLSQIFSIPLTFYSSGRNVSIQKINKKLGQSETIYLTNVQENEVEGVDVEEGV